MLAKASDWTLQPNWAWSFEQFGFEILDNFKHLFANYLLCFPHQDTRKFGAQIRKALNDLMQLLNPNQNEPNKAEEGAPQGKKDL